MIGAISGTKTVLAVGFFRLKYFFDIFHILRQHVYKHFNANLFKIYW